MAKRKGDILIAIIIFLTLIAAVNRYIELPDITAEKETTTVAAWAPGGMEADKPESGDEFTLSTDAETEKLYEVLITTYELTETERDLIERVVMAEAGGECVTGQKAVAKCILNACLITGKRPDRVIDEFQYTANRSDPSEDVIAAVSAVFDCGESVIDDDVLFFYNPDYETSPWHEAQEYVCTIGNHRFFKKG